LSRAYVTYTVKSFPQSGYGPFEDPGEPLVTQTIVGDGERFKVAVFQLAKTELAVDQDPASGTKNNVLWHSPEFTLFEGDKINMEGLKSIVKLYMEKPVVKPKVILLLIGNSAAMNI
jgi:hypothetical protein